MPINLRLSSSASGTRNTGPVNMGGGANMIERSLFASNAPTLPWAQWYTPGTGSPAISASDYYLTGGMIAAKPYDLDTMGSDGATIKAREGKRYVWLIWSDHAGDWPGSTGLFAAYSDDPQVWPEPNTMRCFHDLQNTWSGVDQNGYTQNNVLAYWNPFLVYNPDSAGDKFYIYAECQSTSSSRQHELGLITTNDFQTSTFLGPTIPTTNFNGWTAFGRPVRLGVNNWETFSFGKADATATNAVSYKYTSTDGWAWTPNYSTIVAGTGPFLTISGQRYLLTREQGTPNSYVSLLAVDSSSVSQGTYTRISGAFGDDLNDPTKAYPGPTYLIGADCYEEDGVASVYVCRGYPKSNHDGTNAFPYLDNHPSFYTIVGSITSNVLNVTSISGSVPPLAVGFRVNYLSGSPRITSLGTGTGGTGTYNISSTPDQPAGTTFTIFTNGGTAQQWLDQYYLITDATAAASAAPLGVKASCTAGVVTISWNNSLPHQNYRVYRGTTAGTQATLIGDVTGTSITDTPTAGSQYWYKVVTMNGGEQKSRTVNVYASNNELMVNKHVNRFLNDGGDISKINISFVATAAAWLTSNDAWRYVNWWVDVRFGYKLDGSGFISKIFCLGTTYLPRGGDYTPTTSNTYPSTSSNTSYSATSFRGTTPSWINNSSTARGYFGGGRANNIQRWSEITMLAAYQKPGTGVATFFGMNESTGMYFQHESGTSGNITFSMVLDKVNANTTFTSATVPFSSATAAGVAAAVADSTNMTVYLNGTPGTPVSLGASANNELMLKDTTLRGHLPGDASSAGSTPVLVSGSKSSRFNLAARTYNLGGSEAQYTGAGLAVFNKGFAQSLIQSWGALYA